MLADFALNDDDLFEASGGRKLKQTANNNEDNTSEYICDTCKVNLIKIAGGYQCPTCKARFDKKGVKKKS